MEGWRNAPILWIREQRLSREYSAVGEGLAGGCSAVESSAGARVWVRAAGSGSPVGCRVRAPAALGGECGNGLWHGGRSGVSSSIAALLLSIEVGWNWTPSCFPVCTSCPPGFTNTRYLCSCPCLLFYKLNPGDSDFILLLSSGPTKPAR